MQAAIAEQNIVIANQNDWPDSLQSLIADMRIGMTCAYLFFAAVGAGANISTLFSVATTVMIFAIIVVV